MEGRLHHASHSGPLPTSRGPPSEHIAFHIIHSPRHALILGLPWLKLHNPVISWPELRIMSWREACAVHHRPSEGPLQLNTTNTTPAISNIPELPTEYQDLAEAFSETKATKLPPHRPCDCAIDLLPGVTPPKGRIFPLSQSESADMKGYIEEEHLLASSLLKRKMEGSGRASTTKH